MGPLLHSKQTILIAEKIHSLIQKTLVNPNDPEQSDELIEKFPTLFTIFLEFLQNDMAAAAGPKTPLHMKGQITFPKFYKVANLGEYYRKNQSDTETNKCLQTFNQIEQLLEDNSEKREKLHKLLHEWSTMKPSEKHSARNFDPFVKEFEKALDPIR